MKIIVLFLISSLSSFANDTLTNKTIIKTFAGYTINLLHQINPNNINAYAYQYCVGFCSEKKINKNILSFGLSLTQLEINNFKNTIFDISYPLPINLSTSISQTFIEIPVIYKKNRQNINYGLGLIFSYLFQSNLNQNVINIENDTGNYNERFHKVYDIKNSKETAPFVKTNISPCINFGINLRTKLSIQYMCSYQLLSNPVNNYKFSSFNLLNNSIFLTYQLN